ncbi:tetratricopeptide (TPR) repeat protein [Dysgonomonas sp. PH5-45]|uniref:tetratricopeptide repeat protein n=1 Tax=unclassified Dysgonomonas TaxID=2630389 RepID=UPI002474E729|nr:MULTISPECIES: tetratricopeptide repeat protein [unclassified Dysgonomonas]MDH6354763.1 tetratricopeptide (TPR) repeat protein [Dysgonomonas sp. PH5-45]MDH6387662.1 tetratricopeptide (TPR) repeat protein [Dysgonomonas sp. PH5-37]
MDSANISSQRKNIQQLLAQKQIKDAIEALNKLSVRLQDWQVSEKLGDVEMTYKYMLRYCFEGSEDPQRENVYNGILRTLYELTDDITDEILLIDSTNFFYERSRINALHNNIQISDYRKQIVALSESQALVDLLENGSEKQDKTRSLAIKRERTGSDMFNSVFVSPRISQTEAEQYEAFVAGVELPAREKCLFLSALLMNLLHRFDSKKMQVMMSACTSDAIVVRQRAIVNLIILLQIYDSRLAFYPECVQQLESLSENDLFRKSVLTIVKQLIRARETETISKKLTEEILPEMMRFSSRAKRKLNMDDIMGDGDLSEKNPEWKKELEESGLANKLQEYSNLQMEGADVFHSTFASLKSFPFFTEVSNWFLPFDPQYSELQPLIADGGKDSLLYSAVLGSGHMCNSDKYSFCFSILQIPASQREMMMQQFGAESEEVKKLQKEAMAVNPLLDETIVSNQYIQDLYRFFKLHPSKREFYDIFSLKLDFYDKQTIIPLISDFDSMIQVAAYYFDKNFIPEALNLYLKLSELNELSSDVWQKIGYCQQLQGNTEGALDAYIRADLLLPDNSWTVKRIAQSYRQLKNYEQAIEYYTKVMRLRPDDLSAELNIGHCYLEMKDYEKALNSYFKVEMLGGDNKGAKAWRPIAWVAFLMRRFDLARRYTSLILADKPTIHDYLNAGHIELCQNDLKQAMVFYQNAIYKESMKEFISLFKEDESELITTGVDKNLLPLVIDQLKYLSD